MKKNLEIKGQPVELNITLEKDDNISDSKMFLFVMLFGVVFVGALILLSYLT